MGQFLNSKEPYDRYKTVQNGPYFVDKSEILEEYGGDEVFSAAAQSTAERLRSYGAHVTLEIEKGMYHTYAAMPLVKEARPGYQRMMAYLRE